MSPTRPAVYRSNPRSAPDADFEPGTLAHLALGARGRLLDARRTPVIVLAIEIETGFFVVEVLDFEDAGGRWSVPLEEVERFQFRRGEPQADAATLADYERAVARLDRELAVECDPGARAETMRRVAAERETLAPQLDAAGLPAEVDPAVAIDARTGDERVIDAARAVLDERGLLEIDDAFALRYVGNPWSGELVKGHAIVCAELGLAPFRGKDVRDPALFDGEWSRERRAEHIVVRTALTQEIWGRAELADVAVHRANPIEPAAPARRSRASSRRPSPPTSPPPTSRAATRRRRATRSRRCSTACS